MRNMHHRTMEMTMSWDDTFERGRSGKRRTSNAESAARRYSGHLTLSCSGCFVSMAMRYGAYRHLHRTLQFMRIAIPRGLWCTAPIGFCCTRTARSSGWLPSMLQIHPQEPQIILR